MNYRKMRAILIVLLFFTNLIMFTSLASTKINDRNIQQKMSADNLLFLENRGVVATEEMLLMQPIGTSLISYDVISLMNIEKIIYDITVNENNVFIGENGTAKVNDDGSFIINLNQAYEKENIEIMLIQAGFNFENLEITPIENGYKYTLKINEILVSNCYFEVILNDSTATIAGKYVFGIPQIAKSQDVFNMFLAIVEISNFYDFDGDIMRITFEYVLSYNENFKITPVYRIETMKNVYYYDIYNNSITNF